MGDYNKPITARIQHSTSKGMKIQEPLLDIGTVANANATLIKGEKAAAGRPADSSGSFNAGMDSQKSESKQSTDTGTQSTTPGPDSETEDPSSPAPFNAALRKAKEDGKLPPAFAAVVKKTKGPEAMAKNYKKGYYGA